MRILFAAPNRDLLQCYQALLSEDGDETTTAFDGAQALNLIRTGAYDLVILDQNLPLVPYRQLLPELQAAGMRSILLLDSGLEEGAAPDASIAYPFLPAELQTLISEVTSHE